MLGKCLERKIPHDKGYMEVPFSLAGWLKLNLTPVAAMFIEN